jgi:peroxiredoxin/outer membrane lipoprotein-sorting protein
MPGRTVVLASCLFLPGLMAPSSAEAQSLDAAGVVAKLSARCAAAREYMFEGELLVEGQHDSLPARLLSKAKVRFAAAQPGKSYLWIDAQDKDEYTLLSDGQKSWAFVPALKQYTEVEANVLAAGGEGTESAGAESDQERDPGEDFVRAILPTLASLRATAQTIDSGDIAEVKYQGKKVKWPTLRVLSRTDDRKASSLAELTLDPATLAVARLVYSRVTYRGSERYLVRLSMDFASFRVGEPLPDATFTFRPPKKAKRVDAVPIPGQTGSFLLNRPAPDFESRTLDGERIKLADLRGHPVLLDFWASWCGPCRKELPGLVNIHEELKDKGLIILGVNDEPKSIAQRFAAEYEIPFSTLEDSDATIHRLYRVRTIPSVYLIDAQGKVVRFFVGARDEATLRAALRSVGIQ